MPNIRTLLPAAALAALPLATSAAGQAVYLGGVKQIQAARVASDSAGNRYVAGTVFFNSGYELVGVDADIFLTKIAPDGTIVYTLYFGGDRSDELRGMAVDQAGRVYLVGTTGSANFPAVNALQPRLGGGRLLFSTFLSGKGTGTDTGIAVDDAGRVCVIGTTSAADFPSRPGSFS